MKHIAFTICSNNYLPKARILYESLLEFNPGYHFIIGLVDQRLDWIDYGESAGIEVIPVTELKTDPSLHIFEKFDIVELNTAVKPCYFKEIRRRYPFSDLVMYFDPDIAIFSDFSVLEKAASSSSFLLTPHILSPIEHDGKLPLENTFLHYGLYNLGFLGLSFRTEDASMFLDWWEYRTLRFGFNQPHKSLFVDQLWINFVPLYYEAVTVFRHKGMNMGPWNLHERKLTSLQGNRYLVNGSDPLVFYHFSSYDHKYPERIAVNNYTRYSFSNHPDLLPLYDWYRAQLLKHSIERYESIPCCYGVYKPKKQSKSRYHRLVEQLLPPVLFRFISK